MSRADETVGQAWIRHLSLVNVDGENAAAFREACKSVLAINPMLGMDANALHFTAQGWLAARQHSSVRLEENPDAK